MTELTPINLGFGIYITEALVKLCIYFDKWALDYEILELNKLNEMD